MENIILIGAGGHCRACIDVIEQSNVFQIKGILDRDEMAGRDVLGYPIIGTDDDIASFVKLKYNFLISFGQIKSSEGRQTLFNKLVKLGAKLPVIVSSKAYISKHAKIGAGTIVMHNGLVNAGARIGLNCILNTGSVVEHDCLIGNHVHISTESIVNGNCKIGHQSFIGSNVTISNNITLVEKSIIGAGAVVTADITESGVYAGIPAYRLHQ
ncbi:acetyltransferase [Pedobacter sp. JY14-1]|uniref:acetyltransferase n=1 Tax=Pedobacter sp. JY14-1 TaxID=3034151 RepID=UPI0023E2FC05|nr:acetyltransferase [Pedobacter sp. JY14-1]